ncbi:MAG: hypothetical protein CMJ58_12340 [Planctomycetaceae bacterium]|nr:hypothetical protein [Planctomycetaceae bacterium]
MSIGFNELLHQFDQLPPGDQAALTAELCRRVAARETSPISDDDLTHVADELFQQLDAHEQQDAGNAG